MEFSIVLKSTLVMMMYMSIGYVLAKTGKAEISQTKVLSSFLVYCATPGMIISSLQEMEYSAGSASVLFRFLGVSFVAQLVMLGLMFFLFRKQLSSGRYRMLCIGSFLGNVGFFGQPVVISLFPGEALPACCCIMFAAGMNLIIFTVGEYMISGDRRFVSFRRMIFNPAVLAVVFALPLYFLKIRLPSPVYTVTATLRTMSAPVCMILLGLRLASMSAGEVFGQPFAYLVSFFKLLVFPCIALLLTFLLPDADRSFRLTMFVAAATPCASIILALCEMHDCEQKTAAYSLLVSTMLSALTLPLMVLLFTKFETIM